jgi:hypothetical protein
MGVKQVQQLNDPVTGFGQLRANDVGWEERKDC